MDSVGGYVVMPPLLACHQVDIRDGQLIRRKIDWEKFLPVPGDPTTSSSAFSGTVSPTSPPFVTYNVGVPAFNPSVSAFVPGATFVPGAAAFVPGTGSISPDSDAVAAPAPADVPAPLGAPAKAAPAKAAEPEAAEDLAFMFDEELTTTGVAGTGDSEASDSEFEDADLDQIMVMVHTPGRPVKHEKDRTGFHMPRSKKMNQWADQINHELYFYEQVRQPCPRLPNHPILSPGRIDVTSFIHSMNSALATHLTWSKWLSKWRFAFCIPSPRTPRRNLSGHVPAHARRYLVFEAAY